MLCPFSTTTASEGKLSITVPFDKLTGIKSVTAVEQKRCAGLLIKSEKGIGFYLVPTPTQTDQPTQTEEPATTDKEAGSVTAPPCADCHCPMVRSRDPRGTGKSSAILVRVTSQATHHRLWYERTAGAVVHLSEDQLVGRQTAVDAIALSILGSVG